MGEKRTVEAMMALEWYDGIVAGFIRLLGSNFLCVMLAFDAATSRRQYVLVPVEAGAFRCIALSGLGDYLQSALDDALTARLDIYLSHDEPTVGGDIVIEPIDQGRIALLKTLRFPRIDDAVLPSTNAQWL